LHALGGVREWLPIIAPAMRSVFVTRPPGKARSIHWLSGICSRAVSPAAASQVFVSIAGAPASVAIRGHMPHFADRPPSRSPVGRGL
jgi:hypothetical protein